MGTSTAKLPAEGEEFLRYLASQRAASAHTLRAYRNDLAQFAAYLKESGSGLLAANATLIRGYLLTATQKGLTKRSIGRKIASVRSLYRFLVRNGTVPANPASSIRLPRVGRTLPSFLTEQEASSLLAVRTPEAEKEDPARSLRDLAILEALYGGGLRSEETVRLRASDVNLSDGSARVLGKGNKERIVQLGRQAIRRSGPITPREPGSLTRTPRSSPTPREGR